ncbi:small ribosomal subunit protein uS7m-like [Ornithodoros turicata]|uniref:small ribosomal subunit protein uS7m-like n=1 Tax=Ornithodoros turicata TaxID=34597 RepID=UPI00313907BA
MAAASPRAMMRLCIQRAFLSKSKPLITTQVRTSVYHKGYIEPIVDRQQLKELEESGKLKELRYASIKAAKSEVTSSVFYDPIVQKFINMFMREGDKSLARRVIELALYNVKKQQLTKYNRAADDESKSKIECNPVTILHTALENCKPCLELTPIKRGGITYQVPIPMTAERSRFLSMKWLIEASNDKDPKARIYDQMAKEILDAYNNHGRVVKRKHELHKQCEANKAYAHYRWS